MPSTSSGNQRAREFFERSPASEAHLTVDDIAAGRR